MKHRILHTKRLYLGVIILITTLGSVLFFPVNIGGRYTCFYHRLFDPPQSAEGIVEPILGQSNPTGHHSFIESSYHHSVLLDKYMHRYVFIWWGSVGLLALCTYLFLRMKRELKVNDPGLTVNK